MENVLIFASEKEVRFTKLLKFIVPTYLTSLFNTVYTIIDGIFVSTYVGIQCHWLLLTLFILL